MGNSTRISLTNAKDIDANYNGQLWAQPVSGGPGRKLADFGYGWTTLARGAQLLFTEHLVEDTNTPAIALYKQQGFAVHETMQWVAYGDRIGPNQWVMLTRKV